MVTYNSFHDIPQIPWANYHCDFMWESIDAFLAENNVEYDPPYQRGYVWTQEQKERYIEFCLMGGRSGRDLHFNCPNWDTRDGIVESDWGGKLEIVDGKQRLNAVRGFLANEVMAFGKLHKDYEGHLRITQRFVVNINSLKAKESVVDWYLAMNRGGSIHTDSDIQVALDYKNSLKTL